MQAWGLSQCKQSVPSILVKFMADPTSALTVALGLKLDHPGPVAKLGPNRCKRHACYVVDGVIRALEVSEKEDDPAGDDFPESSSIDNMLAVIEALGPEEHDDKRKKTGEE